MCLPCRRRIRSCGVKKSEQGRESGIEGLDNYIELKTVHFA
jgi:acyl-CoA reductase-like NAD-dependent aldehyde dehydrogenase